MGNFFRCFAVFLLLTLATSVQAQVRVLVYGDSNTWGWKSDYAGGPYVRYADHERWAGVMSNALGANYVVTVNGLIGRTVNVDLSDGVGQLSGEDENGRKRLAMALAEAGPVNVVIVALGTNDLMDELGRSPADIAADLRVLAAIIERGTEPATTPLRMRFLVVAPPPLGDTRNTIFDDTFGAGAIAKSRQLAAAFSAVGKELGIEVIDAGQLISTDGKDGVHLSMQAHARLGLAVAEKLKSLVEEGANAAH